MTLTCTSSSDEAADMSKRPTDRDEPAAKKRGSDRQRTKEHPSSEEEEVQLPHKGFTAAPLIVLLFHMLVAPLLHRKLLGPFRPPMRKLSKAAEY